MQWLRDLRAVTGLRAGASAYPPSTLALPLCSAMHGRRRALAGGCGIFVTCPRSQPTGIAHIHNPVGAGICRWAAWFSDVEPLDAEEEDLEGIEDEDLDIEQNGGVLS